VYVVEAEDRPDAAAKVSRVLGQTVEETSLNLVGLAKDGEHCWDQAVRHWHYWQNEATYEYGDRVRYAMKTAKIPVRGRAQAWIVSKVGKWPTGHSEPLSDIARGFRGHYAALESAAEVLAKKGWITFDGSNVGITPKAEEALAVFRTATLRESPMNKNLRNRVIRIACERGLIRRADGKPWSKLPKGWTDESVDKMWESMTGDVKHKVTKCMEKMKGKVDDTGAFCGSLADKVTGTTKWRGKKAADTVEDVIIGQISSSLSKYRPKESSKPGSHRWVLTLPNKLQVTVDYEFTKDQVRATLWAPGARDIVNMVEYDRVSKKSPARELYDEMDFWNRQYDHLTKTAKVESIGKVDDTGDTGWRGKKASPTPTPATERLIRKYRGTVDQSLKFGNAYVVTFENLRDATGFTNAAEAQGIDAEQDSVILEPLVFNNDRTVVVRVASKTVKRSRRAKEKWIPEDLEEGRCTPGSPNYDCPKGSPQYNLAQTFKKHPEWGEKGGKKASNMMNTSKRIRAAKLMQLARQDPQARKVIARTLLLKRGKEARLESAGDAKDFYENMQSAAVQFLGRGTLLSWSDTTNKLVETWLGKIIRQKPPTMRGNTMQVAWTFGPMKVEGTILRGRRGMVLKLKDGINIYEDARQAVKGLITMAATQVEPPGAAADPLRTPERDENLLSQGRGFRRRRRPRQRVASQVQRIASRWVQRKRQKRATTPYQQNQQALIAEAGNKLQRLYDPSQLAAAIVKLRSFQKMVGRSRDMVKDALIALEDGGAIRKLDDDLFYELRDEVERLMGFAA
jgi:hypothetical protein